MDVNEHEREIKLKKKALLLQFSTS